MAVGEAIATEHPRNTLLLALSQYVRLPPGPMPPRRGANQTTRENHLVFARSIRGFLTPIRQRAAREAIRTAGVGDLAKKRGQRVRSEFGRAGRGLGKKGAGYSCE
jgi:hypothetical protein